MHRANTSQTTGGWRVQLSEVVTRFKQPRLRSPAHLAWIRTLRCCVRGCYFPSEPHHLKCGPQGGGSVVAGDDWAVPVCRQHHDAAYPDGLHRHGREMVWWHSKGLDPIAIASWLAFLSRCHGRIR